VTSGIAEEILAGNISDGAITPALRAETVGAQVWTPSSRLWLQRLALDAPQHAPDPQQTASLAESQLVLAMPQTLEDQLHWDQDPPTWAQAMAALKDGTVKYAQDNPRYSTSGTLAAYLTFAAAAGGAPDGKFADLTAQTVQNPAVKAFVSNVQGAAKGGFVPDSTNILRSWATQSVLPSKTMLLVQDQMVWGYDSGQYNVATGGQPNVQLVEVQPRMAGSNEPESLVADQPYAILPGATTQEQTAATDFLTYIKTHWTPFCTAGFHDSTGRAPNLSCRAPSLDHSVGETSLATGFHSIPLPSTAVQEKMVTEWLNLRSSRRILIAMDVSGSMQKDRLAAAIKAVKDGISLLRPQDKIQVIQFAGTSTFRRPYWTVVPLQSVGSASNRNALLANLNRAPTSAERQQTGLLSAVSYAYGRMSKLSAAKDPNSPLDAVIVLSDGIDEWNTGATADSICNSLQSIPHVPVYTVHYDPEANEGYTAAQVQAGDKNLATLASCTSPQGLADQSDDDPSLSTVFRQIIGSL
jgi:Ca-activated chloride channel family protein